MSSALPKGEQSAYQRWELASFGNRTSSSPTPAVPTISANELAALKESARLEGYANGYREGYENGHREGETEGKLLSQEKMDVEVAHFVALNQKYAEQLSHAHKEVSQELLDLSLSLAQAMVATKIELEPNTILAIVQEAIDLLPSVHQPAKIHLHPLDAAIVKQKMAEEANGAAWRVVSDQDIERGGCKLDTAHNQVDATMAMRWKTLSKAFLPNDNS